jgi:branched-chain amino acid transport system ATP-binding protein
VIIGLPIAGTLVVRLGWRAAVIALAAVATAVSILTLLLKEPVRGGMDRAELGADADPGEDAEPPPSWREALRAAWAVRTLRRQAYAQGVQSLVLQPVGLLVSLLMAEKFFLDPSQRAMLLTAQAVAALPAFLLGGAIADRLIRFRPASLVAAQASLHFVAAGSLVVLAVNNSFPVFAATSVVTAFVVAALLPASSVVVSLVAPARVRGVGFQMAAPFVLIGLALGPAVVSLAQQVPLQQGLLFFVPFNVLGAMIILSSAGTVASDMRAARAAAVAGDAARLGRLASDGPLVVCRDLDVAAGPVTIVHHVDLDIGPGECVALLGTNGAGKSTLLRALAGLQEPANGAIVVDGRDTTHVPAHENARAGVVLLPGGEAVFPTLTVRQNVELAAGLAGAEVALGLFPALRDRLDTRAGDLSGGEQQMLAITQVALMRPRLLLIDELSLGLAPKIVSELLDMLRRINQAGAAVVLVEQSVNVALSVVDHVYFMEKGEIRFDGRAADLMNQRDLLRSVFLEGAAKGLAQ